MSKISNEEKIFFEELTKIRENGANYLEMPFLRGVKGSVVDKYSDRAHFIYELLQNADDAKATEAKFILKNDGLYFSHNGSIHFTISDPNNEDNDKQSNRLGHINSITSIANSAKNESSIGKFGVGFKAVFQYTNTPYIFDPRIKFKIERFIVPRLIKDNLEDDITQNEADTVFYFPFDKTDLSTETAFSEILEKLQSLIFPTLFLSNVNCVSWQTNILEGKYSKETITTETKGDMTIRLLELSKKIMGTFHIDRLWLISRPLEKNHTYYAGFFIDKEKKLQPVDYSAFCFFPTKEKTGLRFIIQAPFLLIDSRERIKAGVEWNKELIKKLSLLAADSLAFFKDEGILNDTILDIIPYRESDFSDEKNNENISFKPFYHAIKEKLQKEYLLPSKDGTFTSKDHAYWAESTTLAKLFSNEQLAELVKDADAKWVFTGIGRTKDDNLTNYIDGGDERWGRPPNLLVSNLDPVKILNKMTSNFVKSQYDKDINWLHDFYEYLQGTKYGQSAKTLPIFVDTGGNTVPAFDENNQLILFLPAEDESEYTTIHKNLLSNEISRKYFEEIGIKLPGLKDEIYNKLLPKYGNSGVEIDTSLHFRKFFKYYTECPNNEIPKYLELIKDKNFIHYYSRKNGKSNRGIADTIYMPSDELELFFETKPDTRFLDIQFYRDLLEKSEEKNIMEFFFKLGVNKFPKIIKKEITDDHEKKIRLNLSKPDQFYGTYDKHLDGCEELLIQINKQKSLLLWAQLITMIVDMGFRSFRDSIRGEHKYFYYSLHPQDFDSEAYKILTQPPWLFGKDGIPVKPNEINIDDLSDEYDKKSEAAKSLIGFLQIKDNSKEEAAANQLGLSVSQYKYLKENPDIIARFIEDRKRDDDRPKFPERTVADYEQRIDRMAEHHTASEEKKYEKRDRLVRISAVAPNERKTYLENHYTNNDDRMVCQICENEMPFKKRDGNYYYEAVEILTNKYLKKENHEQYLALCPECSARYNEFVLHDDEIMENLRNQILNGTEMELNLGEITREKKKAFVKAIRFVDPHLLDLKIILQKDLD